MILDGFRNINCGKIIDSLDLLSHLDQVLAPVVGLAGLLLPLVLGHDARLPDIILEGLPILDGGRDRVILDGGTEPAVAGGHVTAVVQLPLKGLTGVITLCLDRTRVPRYLKNVLQSLRSLSDLIDGTNYQR